MPSYDFINDDTGEVREITLRMTEEKVYVDEDGKSWRRIFAAPQALIDGKMDAWSTNKFVEKTSKPDTYGALIDRSRELSEKRAKDAGGIDPIRAKAEADYSKKRKGRKYTGKISDPTFS